jgi:hypothetical protein
MQPQKSSEAEDEKSIECVSNFHFASGFLRRCSG